MGTEVAVVLLVEEVVAVMAAQADIIAIGRKGTRAAL